jgi:hypothetical protein
MNTKKPKRDWGEEPERRLSWWVFALCGMGMAASLYALLVIFVPSFVPEILPDKRYQVWRTEMAGNVLWIPALYYSPAIYEAKTDDVLLRALYPDLGIVKDSDGLYRRNEQFKIIRMLVSRVRSNVPLEIVINDRIDRYETNNNKGVQYGLEYLTQMPNNPKDWGELWIEMDGEKKMSFIDCDKVGVGSIAIPQCSHQFILNGIFFDIGYDKKQLPNWKEIRDKSVALFEGFKTRPFDILPTKYPGKYVRDRKNYLERR